MTDIIHFYGDCNEPLHKRIPVSTRFYGLKPPKLSQKVPVVFLFKCIIKL